MEEPFLCHRNELRKESDGFRSPLSSLSFRQSDLWKVPCSFSSHSSPSKLVLSTCSRPAGKDPPQPPVWLFSSQLPKPRLPQQFPRVLLCHPGCQNWAHLLGKEVKGRVMGGLPYHAILLACRTTLDSEVPASCVPSPVGMGTRG